MLTLNLSSHLMRDLPDCAATSITTVHGKPGRIRHALPILHRRLLDGAIEKFYVSNAHDAL
jgi:hypothetical protein